MLNLNAAFVWHKFKKAQRFGLHRAGGLILRATIENVDALFDELEHLCGVQKAQDFIFFSII